MHDHGPADRVTADEAQGGRHDGEDGAHEHQAQADDGEASGMRAARQATGDQAADHEARHGDRRANAALDRGHAQHVDQEGGRAREEGRHGREGEPGRDGVNREGPVGEDAAVAAEDRFGADRLRPPQRLGQAGRGREEHGQARDEHDGKGHAPPQGLLDDAPKEGREARHQGEGGGDGREHPGELRSLEAVARRGAGHHDARGGSGGLENPASHQGPDRGRQRAGGGAKEEGAQAPEEDGPAPEPVGQRPPGWFPAVRRFTPPSVLPRGPGRAPTISCAKSADPRRVAMAAR